MRHDRVVNQVRLEEVDERSRISKEATLPRALIHRTQAHGVNEFFIVGVVVVSESVVEGDRHGGHSNERGVWDLSETSLIGDMKEALLIRQR